MPARREQRIHCREHLWNQRTSRRLLLQRDTNSTQAATLSSVWHPAHILLPHPRYSYRRMVPRFKPSSSCASSTVPVSLCLQKKKKLKSDFFSHKFWFLCAGILLQDWRGQSGVRERNHVCLGGQAWERGVIESSGHCVLEGERAGSVDARDDWQRLMRASFLSLHSLALWLLPEPHCQTSQCM